MAITSSERLARHVVIGGGSGFIGRSLTQALRTRGDRVTWISRQAGLEALTWEALARDGLPSCDAVVDLAGQHILNPRRRWNGAYRDEVIRSRVETTKTLVAAIDASPRPPAVFVSSRSPFERALELSRRSPTRTFGQRKSHAHYLDGQVTIPADIREQAGLLPDTEVEFIIDGTDVRIRRVERSSARNRGERIVAHLKGRGDVDMTTDEIMALMRGD